MDTVPRTWQDAFNTQPVTKIKTLERELRANSLRDKERLRSLVGSNYRDLLTTAERITILSTDAGLAEQSISTLSHACQRPDIQTSLREPTKSTERIAQLKLAASLLRLCLTALEQRAVGRVSKLWILARLLVNHLDETMNGNATIRWLQKRIKHVRSSLQECINVMMIRPTISVQQLVEAATAHCLITSNSSTEVVSHLLQLRARKFIALEPNTGTSKAKIKQVTQACHYLVTSVSAARVLAGRRVSDALTEIQRRPLLEAIDMDAIESLQMDLVRDLIPTDILQFTPYFKRTSPTAVELTKTIRTWIELRCKDLIKHIGLALSRCNMAGILHARSEVLKAILPAAFTAQLQHTGIEQIRQSFLDRIQLQLETHAQSLCKIGEDLTAAHVNTSVKSVWQLETITSSSNGGTSIDDIRSNHFGIDKAVKIHLDRVRSWLSQIRQFEAELVQISKSRWQDVIEDVDDDVEDETLARSIVLDLNKHDFESSKQVLHDAVRDCCQKCTAQLQDGINRARTGEVSSASITIMLRIIREMSGAFHNISPEYDLQPLIDSKLQLELVLAEQTLLVFKRSWETKATTNNVSSFVSDDLPSPTTIGFLKDLCKSMSSVGGIDLWTASAIEQLALLIQQKILDSPQREIFIRTPLDEEYIRLALGNKSNTTNIANAIIARRAELYWNRTKALWGVLDTESASI